jgi:deoxyribose-phosphate aldolase
MTQREISKVYNHTDLTNLKKNATNDNIKVLCKNAIALKSKSVCVAPHYVSLANTELTNEKPLVCTVIGFPNGYSTTNTKVYETKDAIDNGADEIDMVININMVKSKQFEALTSEIKQLADICHANLNKDGEKVILKVIVETCLLNAEEIIKLCDICIEAGADYIKTSTGFDSAGAQLEDIKMMATCIGDRPLKIKASGGIRSVEKAQAMMNAGADRIGASSLES